MLQFSINTSEASATAVAGIVFSTSSQKDCQEFFLSQGIREGLSIEAQTGGVRCKMDSDWVRQFAPDHSTLNLQGQNSGSIETLNWGVAPNLIKEILWAMLLSPVPLAFPNLAALLSAVRVKKNIAEAAQKTALAFKTAAAERPRQYWRYEEDAGFVLQPGAGLIDALTGATQPDASGKLYDFSCYRASEYVMLLGLAQEAQLHHPELMRQLQHLNEVHAVRSAEFHEVFLIEHGSLELPLPTQYFVPGDRIWFKNPDEPSSNVTGYEGSWVIYLGGGLFSNFWKRNQPYTLVSKCVEIYHWRHGLQSDACGNLSVDEALVEQLVNETFKDPVKLNQVLSQMMRIRDPKGVYDQGGCLDATRESPKQIASTACDLVLPHY